ncbi:hypothetical protein DEU56DRAFT_962412 [Suillus clintonianus]|uniref:uncharacterized protein n=1 Tax=Suillus clintonianus TaxID=1904413 RepID=UPI001B86D292|nr:uncharacterized protein DEU56DRAFT_962412 [Suillus clintonianus]KAG2150874.1 hypothetical protein DEU56DRAFT_962412 [Suillus clintonianus]
MPVTTRLLSSAADACINGSYECKLQQPSATSYRGSCLQGPRLGGKMHTTFVKSPSPHTSTHPPNNTVTSLEPLSKSKVQVIKHPAPTPLQREASPKPADEYVPRDDLRKRIIAAIRDPDNVEEVEEFFNVSQDDYLYILDAIDEDEDGDGDKVIRKLVYAEELKLLTATLPNRLHQAYLAPMSATLLGAVGSMGIPYRYGQIRIQTDIHLLSAVGVKLGVPDMVMEYKDPDGDCIPLWATEISVSQTKKSATRRLGNYMVKRKDLLAITSIDVEEMKKHAGPRSGSEAVDVLEERPSVSTFSQWLSFTATNDEDPTVMRTFRHVWQQPLTVTITTWLRRPDGSFRIDEEDPDLCATAYLFPERSDLEDVDRVFRCTLERIRDHVVSLIGVRSPRVVEDAPFDRIHAWSPPTPLIEWDLLADEIIVGARQTGYTRYAGCHQKILKRKAEADEVTTGGSGTSKRTRAA